MRQIHIDGQKVFVDFASEPSTSYNPITGEVPAIAIYFSCLGLTLGHGAMSDFSLFYAGRPHSKTDIRRALAITAPPSNSGAVIAN